MQEHMLPALLTFIFMKMLIILLMPLIAFGQKNCSGIIVNGNTGIGIPYATVGLLWTNTGVSANEKGEFTINVSSSKIDSLRITSVGYETLILPQVECKNGAVIKLKQVINLLEEVKVSNKTNKVYTLNQFKRCSWNSYRTGLNATYQLAQRFKTPKQGMQLTEIELCKDPAESIFRIRVYDINSECQCPSNDLADTIIEVRSQESHVKVDLESFNIFIPGPEFFVSIEWLFIPFNEEQEKLNRGKATFIYYRPAIKYVQDRNLRQGYLWKLGFNGRWSQTNLDHYNFQITTKLR